MDNIFDFLHHLMAMFIFCMAVSAFFFLNGSLNGLIGTTKSNMNNNKVLYENYYRYPEEEMITLPK